MRPRAQLCAERRSRTGWLSGQQVSKPETPAQPLGPQQDSQVSEKGQVTGSRPSARPQSVPQARLLHLASSSLECLPPHPARPSLCSALSPSLPLDVPQPPEPLLPERSGDQEAERGPFLGHHFIFPHHMLESRGSPACQEAEGPAHFCFVGRRCRCPQGRVSQSADCWGSQVVEAVTFGEEEAGASLHPMAGFSCPLWEDKSPSRDKEKFFEVLSGVL